MTELKRPPREDLVRAALRPELTRSDEASGGRPHMVGHFAKFGEWTEIYSRTEGHFMERFMIGSFRKTLGENRRRIQAIYHHGLDPSIGSKPLGPIHRLEEDTDGPAYDVELLDAPYVNELIPALEAGLLGSSFRFGVMKEDLEMRPKKSAHNPKGLPERSVTEAYVREFGPTPFAQYDGATAVLQRSLTDDFLRARLESDETPAGRSMISLSGFDLPSGASGSNTASEWVMVLDGDTGDAVFTDPTVTRGDLDRPGLYERCVSYVSGNVWLCEPGTLLTIKQILSERSSGARPSELEIAERIRGGRDQHMRTQPAAGSPVAVIPVLGTIMPRAEMFTNVSQEGTSVQGLQKQLRAALADDQVKAILLDVDSPGGSSELVQEVAAEIRAANDVKPVVAHANAWAASAAYWILSSAGESIVSPSGMVGSIGAYTVHEDISVQQAKEGVKTTLISAGKHKVETSPLKPLSDAGRQILQGIVNTCYDQFVSAVAENRGVDVDTVKNGFGEGHMVSAVQAATLGMVDRVGTFDEILAELENRFAGDSAGEASVPRSASEPEPSAAATPAASEPEPPAATTPAAAAREAARTMTALKAGSGSTSTGKEPSEMDATTARTLDEKRDRLSELRSELSEIDAANVGHALDADTQTRWDAIITEIQDTEQDIAAQEQRAEEMDRWARDTRQTEPTSPHRRISGIQAGGVDTPTRSRVGRGERVTTMHDNDLWDLSTVRTSALNPNGMAEELRSRALVSVERSVFPYTGDRDEDGVRDHIRTLLDTAENEAGDLARHMLITGSPGYRRAWAKAVQGRFLSNEETRALATGSGPAGGYAVPYQLDPTVINTSDGVVNPIRSIARVERTISNEWRGVTSAGVVAHYRAEGAEVDDDSPTLAQPVVTPERVDCFVPFSMEIQQDWRGIEGELAQMINEAKDELEATKFLFGAGSGSNEPQGIFTGLDNDQRVLTDGATAFDTVDLYALRGAVPPRFRKRLRFIGNLEIFDLIRQFDTGGGADLWVRLGEETPDLLIGRPAHEASEMDSDVAAGAEILLAGDFKQYLIVDRIGMSVELVPHLFGSNRRPTGQRGFFAFWRNSAGVLVDNAFRFLQVAAT